MMPSKLTHIEYIKNLKDKSLNFMPLEDYCGNQGKILHMCLDCGYKFVTTPNTLKSKNFKCSGCNINHAVLIVGKNDMWTTNPIQASLLLDLEDGYKYMQNTNKKLNWRCPDCGNIIYNRSGGKVISYGLICNICSDKVSKCQRFMSQILKQLNVTFKTEKSFDWCKFKLHNKDYRGRYDFLIYEKKLIIETDGGFHDIPHSKSKLTIEDVKFIDHEKDRLAIDNNYKLVRIDCRNTELNYMTKSILSSELNNIFDFSCIDFKECYIQCLVSNQIRACNLWNEGIKSVIKISKILNVSDTTARTYLKHMSQLNLCDYKPQQINQAIKSSKSIMCVTTGEVFSSIGLAAKHYNMCGSGHISQVCNGQRKYAGIHPDTNEKLVWKYH